MPRKDNIKTSSDLDIQSLSNHFWEVANKLCSPVGATDFKTYIFPILFFKRISDVHDEEYYNAREELNSDAQWTNKEIRTVLGPGERC